MSAAEGSAGSVRWRYQAADADGTAVRGEIEAESERDAVDALRRRSLWVIALEPAQPSATPALRGDGAMAGDHVVGPSRWWHSRETDLAVVVRAMSTLIGAGVPLYRALTYAARQAADPMLRASFAAVRDAVERGESLSAAVGEQSVFPPVFGPLIGAGEASGTLSASLALLADDLERRDALRTKLRSALVYPSILGVASVLGVVVILLVVVPRFGALITDGGGTLPLSTRALIALSTALTKGWWAALLAIFGGGALLERTLRNPSARRAFDERRLRWPVFGAVERTRASAAYTGTLAVALRAGVSLLGSMALARAVVGNRYLANAMREAETRVRAGTSVSSALSGLLPPLAERLLDAGETSGDLAGMAARAADAADAEWQRQISQSVTLIEPVMILGFGGIVGFVALALLQAIYGLNASVL